ncbi:tigger transposable element-derived protein 1-like [Polypterus senegalus]|uniref:tigger transposable element-derived protein 1-like n=1 Tax=Polypterus senegalus TaxID=55291 RepID=UPI001962BA3E|nr:tigger transposable element-derived protein 1-like [Polypterus senegalus]
MAGDSLSESIICEKARAINADLLKDKPSTSDSGETFRASKGWFHNFKARTGIHSVVRHGEAASADKSAAENYIHHFETITQRNGFCSHQAVNRDETGLFWKKMPRRTLITQEEKKMLGHKPMKDRLTLLLYASGSGDLKIKPLLVYHSETPRVFRKHTVMKNRLGVMWRSKAKAWVTRVLFLEWIREVFCPTVKKYLEDKGLPLKDLLIMDNAPAHPRDLEEELAEEFPWLIVEFPPPNTTHLLQPMDQQVIANFRKLYTKELFQKCFQMVSDTDLTLTEFWKKHYNILSCVGLIGKSWANVSLRTLRSAWEKVWPKIIEERDFEGFVEDPEPATDHVVDDIVTIAQSIGLQVGSGDVDELVEEHSEELSTEVLQQLLAEQQKMAAEELSEEEGEDQQSVQQMSSSEIKDILKNWTELQTFVEKTYPDREKANCCINLLNDNVMSYCRTVLKKRQKQITLDQFLFPKRLRPCEPEAGPSGLQPLPRRERTPEGQSPDVLKEGDSPSKQ